MELANTHPKHRLCIGFAITLSLLSNALNTAPFASRHTTNPPLLISTLLKYGKMNSRGLYNRLKFQKKSHCDFCNDQLNAMAIRCSTQAVFFISVLLNCITFSWAVPQLIFEDNFDTLNRSTWQHLITSWRGGESQFQYYTNRTENR